MLKTQQRICRLADEAAAIEEPEAALRTLSELRVELVEFERARVSEALESGSSFGAVAKALGISRQAAHRRYRDLAPLGDDPLPLSSPARRAVHHAREEATATGSTRVGSRHLLLGVLRGGGDVVRTLEAEGVTADAARECMAVDVVPGEPDGGVRSVMAEADEIARARGSRYVEADHIVLAALNAPDGGALRAMTALGVTPAAVRARLGC